MPAIISIFIFSACQKQIDQPQKQDQLLADKNSSSASTSFNASISSSQLPATVIDQHFDFPGPFILTNHCTGEVVTVTGTIGDDMHIVINGNAMNFSEHQQGHLIGTGSLGNTYVTNVNENVTLNGIPFGTGLFIIEDISIFRMVSTNGAPDFTVRRNAHLTVNANGVVTVDRIDFTTNCPG